MRPGHGAEVAESFRETALRYADRGWPVFCLQPHGKVPLSGEDTGRHGCLDATTDMLAVSRWWRDHPDANIGIACGPVGGIFVLDVDVKPPKVKEGDPPGIPGPAALAELERRHGALPPTLTAGTGGGGEHRYFRWPVDVPIRNRARIRIDGAATGLDCRGEGGYVAAPPSIHPDGGVYRWWDPAVPVAEAPRWLLDLLAPVATSAPTIAAVWAQPERGAAAERLTAYGRTALDGAYQDILGAGEGNRHDVIRNKSLWLAKLAAGGCIGWAEAEAALIAAGDATGKDPREVRRAVQWGYDKGSKEPYRPEDREIAPRVYRGPGWEDGPPGMPEDDPGPGAEGWTWQPPSDDDMPPIEGFAPGEASAPVSPTRPSLARLHAEDAAQGSSIIAEVGDILETAYDTKAERAAACRGAAKLMVGALGPLSWLAALAPSEWADAVASIMTAGGMSTLFPPIDRAVRQAAAEHVAALHAEKVAERRRKLAGSKADGGPIPEVQERLSKSKEGDVKSTFANVVTIYRQDPRWDSLRMSKLGDVVEVNSMELLEGPGTADAAEWLRDQYRIDAPEHVVKSALYAVAQGRVYSPVDDYLESIRGLGDGISTIHGILPKHLGIKDPSPLQRRMVTRFLIGAIARAKKPGCKLDTALIFAGKQGAKKSSWFKALFGPEFFGDSPIPIGSKDAPIQLSRVWGYEAAELEDLTSKRTAEAVKAFMSTAADLFRAPFARTARLYPRHTVLCGSFNPRDGVLTDPTGSRRFWIIALPDEWVVPVDLVAAERDAIWAEALMLYERGDPWWFERAEDKDREEAAQEWVEEDPWQALVAAWLNPPGAVIPPTAFTRAKVMEDAIKIPPAMMDRRASARVGAILTRLGWKEHASPSGHRGQRVWLRDTAS